MKGSSYKRFHHFIAIMLLSTFSFGLAFYLSSFISLQHQPRPLLGSVDYSSFSKTKRKNRAGVVPNKSKRDEFLLFASTTTTATKAPVPQVDNEIKNDVAENKKNNKEEIIPSNLYAALGRFFFGNDHGPKVIVMVTFGLIQTRLGYSNFLLDILSLFSLPTETMGSVSFMDFFAACGASIVWWFQEHFMHQKLLHSKWDWMGKSIHESHHSKPYFHISIDPPSLILTWFTVVLTTLLLVCPTISIALSSMIGYSLSGLFYEWTHYIVHTRVKPKHPFFRRLRDHHMRHHLVDNHYWYAFTLPQIDNIFGTNPNVKDVVKSKQHEL